jgi:hypothetical protein
MNSKVWLTTFGVVAFLVVAGTGFYAFSSFSKYSEELSGWDTKVSTIEGLEKRVPYPNEENAKALEKEVEAYRGSVNALSETLKSFQRPLNTTLANTEFQQRFKTRVEDFRAFAKENGFEIVTEDGFYLGFDAYAEQVPAQELVPELDYELEAIDYLLRKLVTSGSKAMTSFERDPIPGEPGGAEKKPDSVVQKYPVRIRFSGSHEVLQTFINALANDREFFYIVRVLKVKNENEEGPVKLTAADGSGFSKFENPITKEVASPEMLAEWRGNGASEADVAEKAKAAGFIKADLDARVLMGQEKLNVFVVVDITRFLSPEEQKALAPQPEAKKGRK